MWRSAAAAARLSSSWGALALATPAATPAALRAVASASASASFAPGGMAAAGVFARAAEARRRHDALVDELAGSGGAGAGAARAHRELARLAPVVEALGAAERLRAEVAQLEELADDAGAEAELRALAREEGEEARAAAAARLRELEVLLLPRDEADDRGCIVEVRAGVGGDEAALFASDLFRMYERFAQHEGFRFEVLDTAPSEAGGYKEASAEVTGHEGAYALLKYESGVHRVQRVPETEAQGRVHTSTASVAVLPQAEDVDVELRDADLRVDTYRSRGAGGQSVNTTDSAVRVTHLPTGLVVAIQDERSQLKNKQKALKVLRARLFDQTREAAARERAAERRSLIGTGDRSERIRTYNFPQGRVKDHRTGTQINDIQAMLAGAELRRLAGELQEAERERQLEQLHDGPL